MTPPAADTTGWVCWTGSKNPDDPVMQEWTRAVQEYRAAKDAEEAAR